MKFRKIIMTLLVLSLALGCEARGKNLKLIYWNIQNGMWSGQGENYESFVDWVKEQNPDICVWCEGQSIWKTASDKALPKEDRYLVEHWGELAARYGHKYWAISAHRDNYPQIITSKYPIETVSTIAGEKPDSVVVHGAGWFRVKVGRRTFNIVSLHTWPQAYAFGIKDTKEREKSKAEHGGDKYRRMEIEYICRHTVETDPSAAEGLWMMMGDHNARSRVDNFKYGYPEDDVRFLVHDYILEHTPYIDVIAAKHPGQFITSTGGESRIDFLYCTPKVYDMVQSSEIISDEYTTPVRDPQGFSNFWHPSDHLPIVTVFKVK